MQENLKVGQMVKYEMRYNCKTKFWDALVVDTKPITLRIKFPDGYVHETIPTNDQLATKIDLTSIPQQ